MSTEHTSSRPSWRRPSSQPRLIQDTPILDVLEGMSNDLTSLRELAPSSDGRTVLEKYFERLSAALEEGTKCDPWVKSAEAARLSGLKSAAAITYRCRNGLVRAKKRGGEWHVHKDDILADAPGGQQ